MALDARHRVIRERLTFSNASGQELAGLLERPDSPPLACALLAHCFTCGKDIGAATRISRALAARGFAVLRFDFTGLGSSEGDFANTNFSSNVADLVSAADYMRTHYHAPELLIGHSLGGAAVLPAARRIPESQAVVAIAAPSDPEHVGHLLADRADEIARQGYAHVSIAGRSFTIRKQFLDDLQSHSVLDDAGDLGRALLVMHSPVDRVVDIEHARYLYQAARHPKSFISLDDADHLLSDRRDSEYVAETIAAWASRYVTPPEPGSPPRTERPARGEVRVGEVGLPYGQHVETDDHFLVADEPMADGGQNTGPSPYELLLAALGSCTSMTLRMYAQHKGWAVDHIGVVLRHRRIHARDCADCEQTEGKVDVIEREIEVRGDLSEEQRERMLRIADKCPVDRTLRSETQIRSRIQGQEG